MYVYLKNNKTYYKISESLHSRNARVFFFSRVVGHIPAIALLIVVMCYLHRRTVAGKMRPPPRQ